jgi:MFS family permease
VKSTAAPTLAVPSLDVQPGRTTLLLAAVWMLTGAAYGCVLPFLAVYAARRGLTVPQIGLLSTVGAGCAAALQPVLGRLVDRTGRPRPILAATALIGAIGWAALGHVSTPPLLTACAALGTAAFYGTRVVLVPTTISILERTGQGAAVFARYRIGPPLAFTVTGMGGGFLLGHLSFALLFSAGALFYLVIAVCGQALPARMGQRELPAASSAQPAALPWTHRVLLTLALMAALYGIATSCADTYVALLMRHLQGSFLQVGLAGTVVTVAEVPLMIIFGRLADRGQGEHGRGLLLTLAMAVLPLRFALYFLVRTPVQLLGVQLLDGPTFAAFAIVGVVLLTDQTPPTERAWALSLYSAASMLGLIAGPVLAGLLAARVGLQPMFGLFALGAVTVPVAVVIGLWPLLRPACTGASPGPSETVPGGGEDKHAE